MKIRVKNLEIPQGHTYTHVFTYVSSAGAAIPLTGYTAQCQIRATTDSATILFDSDDAGGSAVVSEGAGTVTLTIEAATSSAWSWRNATYDIELTNGTSIIRLVKGSVTVDPEVTR